MKNYCTIFTFAVALATISQSCYKNNDASSTENCFINDITTRQIVNKQATIKSINGEFYIVELNTIDERLKPCNLAKEFQTNDLQVMVSGNVKATSQIGMPCCTNNFVITSITK